MLFNEYYKTKKQNEEVNFASELKRRFGRIDDAKSRSQKTKRFYDFIIKNKNQFDDLIYEKIKYMADEYKYTEYDIIDEYKKLLIKDNFDKFLELFDWKYISLESNIDYGFISTFHPFLDFCLINNNNNLKNIDMKMIEHKGNLNLKYNVVCDEVKNDVEHKMKIDEKKVNELFFELFIKVN